MPNTSSQAIAFANSRARVFADAQYSLYLTAKKIVDEWNSQNLSAVIPNDATVISDGAATDGRPPAKNSDVVNQITRAMDIVAYYEGTGALAQAAGRLTTVSAIEVNGRAAF